MALCSIAHEEGHPDLTYFRTLLNLVPLFVTFPTYTNPFLACLTKDPDSSKVNFLDGSPVLKSKPISFTSPSTPLNQDSTRALSSANHLAVSCSVPGTLLPTYDLRPVICCHCHWVNLPPFLSSISATFPFASSMEAACPLSILSSK